MMNMDILLAKVYFYMPGRSSDPKYLLNLLKKEESRIKLL